MNIDGQIALITGGASGLGAATAKYLAGKGAHVMVLDYDLQGAKAMADELGGHAVSCDVSDEDAVARAIDETVSKCGVPRIVELCRHRHRCPYCRTRGQIINRPVPQDNRGKSDR